jgi:hypothetical protein
LLWADSLSRQLRIFFAPVRARMFLRQVETDVSAAIGKETHWRKRKLARDR